VNEKIEEKKKKATLAIASKQNPAPSSHVNTVVKYTKEKLGGKKEKGNVT
jgi:hypothetical protein